MEAFEPPEPRTFEQLMLPHLDSAHTLALWLLRDPHDAQDAVQDAFLRAHRGFAGFRGREARAWIMAIVRNTCYSLMRGRRRAPESVAFEEDLHGAAGEAEPARAVDWRETRGERLREALAKLPAEYREVIVLHEVEGMAYREIAAVAGIPVGTVMSRLSRARARLQAELAGPATGGAL